MDRKGSQIVNVLPKESNLPRSDDSVKFKVREIRNRKIVIAIDSNKRISEKMIRYKRGK